VPPLPKRKYPKSRQGKRRSHIGLRLPQLTECPQCHNLRRPHHPCPVCGHYRGRDAIEVRGPTLPE
jgi:large subunit ribosomal protein L32